MPAVAHGLAATVAVTVIAVPLASRCAPQWRAVSSGVSTTRG